MGKKVFEGLKVADFSWVIAGPLITKYLADYGAEVVRVESNRRPCTLRVVPPYKDKTPGVNRAGYFAYYNANKYSITLNLSNPRGLEVAKRLVAWSDVVVENFAVGIMEKWGLGYEDLRGIKSDIIMMRSSNQGQKGPHASFSAMGIPLVGLSGFSHYTGWPDRDPSPLPIAYNDFMSARFGTVALAAALDYRRRTGKGQCLDMSQVEAGVQFLAPVVLDYTVNEREGGREGNSHPYAAPHGVYCCKGKDRWCAIAVFSEQEWKAFIRVLSDPQWTRDTKFATVLERKKNEEELNKLIEEWTMNLAAEEVMTLMQAAGIAGGIVENARDIYHDPQLRHRGFFWQLKHSELGSFTHLGQSFSLSKTPAKARMPSPLLGEHTEFVCTKILGMSDDEFIKLWEEGAFE